ncbi:MAG: phosphoribosylanthranilate isomerase, partial [Acidimicrobiales bacterium]
SRGRGTRGDWDSLADIALKMPVILAGGLTPENVGDAVRRVHPWGVDVSTGVEVRPGKKDGSKVRRFINAANEAAAEDDPDGLLDDPVTAFAGSPSATQLLAVAKTDEVEAAFYDWDDDSTSA